MQLSILEFTIKVKAVFPVQSGVVYALHIGGLLVKQWSCNSKQWVEEPQKKSKDKYISRKIQVPFESRFVAQDVSVEIRDDR